MKCCSRSTCKKIIYKLVDNRLVRNSQHSQDCESLLCNACEKGVVSVDKKREIFIPQELLEVLDNEGYFRFGIKCIKQVQYLLKILFPLHKVSLKDRKISVKSTVESTEYKLEVNEVGVYVLRPPEITVVIPKRLDNQVQFENNLNVVIKEMLINFHLSQSREDFLLCLNFLIHPRKVTSFVI